LAGGPFNGDSSILVSSTAEHPSNFRKPRHLLPNRITALVWTHCCRALIAQNQALLVHTLQTKNHANGYQAQGRIRALCALRHQCSQFGCNYDGSGFALPWMIIIPEPQARIRSHVARRRDKRYNNASLIPSLPPPSQPFMLTHLKVQFYSHWEVLLA
jgi:hypothetical protein